MFKSSDPLDGLLAGAQSIASKRAEILIAIQNTESRLGEAERELQAARERMAAEECEAAQKEGGLAIASESARQAVVSAELKVKSVRLRLKGFGPQCQAIDRDLLAAWDELEKYREGFMRERAYELSQQFTSLLETILSWFGRMLALRQHCRNQETADRLHCDLSGLHRITLFNPMSMDAKGPIISNAVIDRAGKRTGSLWDLWERDPEGQNLDRLIGQVESLIAPIGAIAKEIRAKG